MLRNLLSFLLLFTSITAFSQTGTIKGVIRTSDGYPAEAVTITLKGTTVITISDKTGAYELKKIKAGAYQLVATFTGLQTKEIRIDVRANGTVVVPEIQLKESSLQLSEVVVSANRNGKESPFVAKLPLKNLENPQVYTVVSSELMKQQAITNYDDALRNVPGIARTWESTGRDGDGAAYFALRGLESQPTMYNGLPGLSSGNLDPADIERIEVIKGPTGTLFGSSIIAYGGLINTVTKKPYYGYGGEITYNAGSFGLNRVTADVNMPLSTKDKIAARVITAYHSENSFQDAGFKRSFFIAPSFSYEVNDKLSFQLMTEILSEERAVAPVFFHSNRADELPFKTIRELNLNNNLSFMSNDLTMKNPRFNLQGQMLYKISEQWTSQTVVSRGSSTSNGYYSYIWPDISGVNYFAQYFTKVNATTNTSDIQQNFTGDFRIGQLRNRMVIGLDAFTRNSVNTGTGYTTVRNVTPQGGDYIDAVTGDTVTPVNLSRPLVDAALAGTGGSNSNVTNSAYSMYVSDVLNITPGLLAMASARIDYFDSKGEKSDPTDDYHQTAVSPKLGLVYQPVLDKVSLFANYMNGFVNVDPRTVYDQFGNNPRTRSFKPEQANQLEFGVKTNLWSNRFSATASYYDIRVSNRVTVDPDNINDYLQGGKVQSKGYELELNANPAKGLNLIAGYSHNDAKVRVGDNDFYSTPGKSPGGQGPQDLANFWATYKVPAGKLKNFGLGLGANYAGEYKVIDSYETGDFYLPKYTLINTSVFYNADNIRVTLNVNNVGNTTYYIGYWSVNPQRPRNVVVSLAYKF